MIEIIFRAWTTYDAVCDALDDLGIDYSTEVIEPPASAAHPLPWRWMIYLPV